MNHNIKTYGFELEFFVKKNGEFVSLDGNYAIPHDECGYLAESRGEKANSPLGAFYNLLHATALLDRVMAQEKFEKVVAHLAPEIPKESLRVWRRETGKGRQRSFFMGGRVYRNDNPRAGLHVHFGTLEVIKNAEGKEIGSVPRIVNIPSIVRYMDKAFAKEIKEAKRMPGEYELKPWGFEYRSLPSTINAHAVVVALEAMPSL